MASAIAASQGARSASVSGVPPAIFSTLARGWKPSASSKGSPSRSATRRPTSVFPQPATPMNTCVIAPA